MNNTPSLWVSFWGLMIISKLNLMSHDYIWAAIELVVAILSLVVIIIINL